MFKSLVRLDPEKIPAQAGFEPWIFRSRGGRLKPLGQRGGSHHVHLLTTSTFWLSSIETAEEKQRRDISPMSTNEKINEVEQFQN